MKVRVKFFCECDAYVEDILEPDFASIKSTDKPTYKFSFQNALCENCYKANEIMIIHYPNDKLIAFACSVEEFTYEVI